MKSRILGVFEDRFKDNLHSGDVISINSDGLIYKMYDP